MNIKSILESLLFVNERPIPVTELVDVLEMDKKAIEQALDELSGEYEQRQNGIRLVKVAGGYQMCSSPENEPWIKKMYREKNKQKLSAASLETLAIVAYKQPITRMEIEAIRGVNIDGVARHLLKTGLIKTGGRKEVVGRPFFYITTRKFLEYFGLNSLRDLPKLEEFASLVESHAPSTQAADTGADSAGEVRHAVVHLAGDDASAHDNGHMSGDAGGGQESSFENTDETEEEVKQ